MKISDLFLNIAFIETLLLATDCTVNRNPVPIEKISQAKIAGIPNIRCGDFNCNPSLDQSTFASSDCGFLAIKGIRYNVTLAMFRYMLLVSG
jgi:hypothetical protein